MTMLNTQNNGDGKLGETRVYKRNVRIHTQHTYRKIALSEWEKNEILK